MLYLFNADNIAAFNGLIISNMRLDIDSTSFSIYSSVIFIHHESSASFK